MRQENYYKRKGFEEIQVTLRQGSTKHSYLIFIFFSTYNLEGLQIYSHNLRR